MLFKHEDDRLVQYSMIGDLMVRFLVAVTVVFGEENLLIEAIARKEDSRSSKAGKQSLEAIPAREGTCVSPRLMPSPWIFLCPNRPRMRRSLEFVQVEAGGIS